MKRRALFIGVNEYEDSQIRDLNYSLSDAHALKTNPNTWGIYDMHGNVWEWCYDRYGEYPQGSVVDPKGPAAGDVRVLRGGSWLGDARFCRSAYRFGIGPGDCNLNCGFRLCCSAGPRVGGAEQ